MSFRASIRELSESFGFVIRPPPGSLSGLPITELAARQSHGFPRPRGEFHLSLKHSSRDPPGVRADTLEVLTQGIRRFPEGANPWAGRDLFTIETRELRIAFSGSDGGWFRQFVDPIFAWRKRALLHGRRITRSAYLDILRGADLATPDTPSRGIEIRCHPVRRVFGGAGLAWPRLYRVRPEAGSTAEADWERKKSSGSSPAPV